MTPAARGAAAIVGIALAAQLAACSYFVPVPDPVERVVDQLTDSISEIPGVDDVTATTRPIDLKDGGPLSNPAAWTAVVDVRASGESASEAPARLTDLVEAIDAEIAEAGATVRTSGSITVAATESCGEVRVGIPSAASDAHLLRHQFELDVTASTLCRLEGVRAVALPRDGQAPSLTVDSAQEWPRTARELRRSVIALPVTIDVRAERGFSRIVIGEETPSPEYVAFLSDLAGRPDVVAVYESDNNRGRPLSDGLLSPTLTVRIETTDAASVERVTSILNDSDIPFEESTRGPFSVYTYAEPSMVERTGTFGSSD